VSAVRIVTPAARHEAAFLAAVKRSRKLHGSLVSPPGTAAEYRRWLKRVDGRTHVSFLVVLREDPDAIVGVVNISEIVRGVFKSGYLGYYAFTPHAGRGLMKAGLAKVIARAFGPMRLHRLEANIQPGNDASIELVKRLGFRCEGYSPRYLRIAGRWRDHERWAVVREG
jgi:ribosomal-protein-alanine N-acetyltransferase